MLILGFLLPVAVVAEISADFRVFLASEHTAAESFAAYHHKEHHTKATLATVEITPQPVPGFAGIMLAVGHEAATDPACGLPADALQGLGNESFVVSNNRSGVQHGCVAISGGPMSQVW
jgi:hypothetical protein